MLVKGEENIGGDEFKMRDAFEQMDIVYRISETNNSELQEINLSTGKVRIINLTVGIDVSTVAYSKKDGFIYGVSSGFPKVVYKIDLAGFVDCLGEVLPSLVDGDYEISTIDKNGYLYIKSISSRKYYTIDLSNEMSETYNYLVLPRDNYNVDRDSVGMELRGPNFNGLDWDYNIKDGNLYGVNDGGNIKMISPVTGIVESINDLRLPAADYMISYFDRNNKFYAVRKNTKKIYIINDINPKHIVINNIAKESEDASMYLNNIYQEKKMENSKVEKFLRPEYKDDLEEIATAIKEESIEVIEKEHIVENIEMVEEVIDDNKPSIVINTNIDKEYVIVSEEVQYTISIENTGDIDIYNINIVNWLDKKLEFIDGSVEINEIEEEEASIISGIEIGILNAGAKVVVKYKALVIDDGVIKTSDTIQFFYKGSEDNKEEVVHIKTDDIIINSKVVDIKIKKTSDKKFVVLRDEIKYKIKIINDTSITASNILVKDEFPQYLEFIKGSFSLNGQPINNINLKNGINIGTIESLESVQLEYAVNIIGNPCSLTKETGVDVSYNYILENGYIGTRKVSTVGEEVNSFDMGISNFKQITVESYLNIEVSKPEVESINKINGDIKIGNYHTVKTAETISNEGQYLTGYKLVINGDIEVVIEYTENNLSRRVHSAKYIIPFSTFIILPRGYNLGSKIEVEGILENLYHKLIDGRVLFVNIATIINAKVVF